jgi:YidC/Oxa1 family membrane protein insertase
MEQRNVILAIVLSVAIILGWQLMFPPPPPPERNAATEQQTADKPAGVPESGAPSGVPGTGSATPSIPGVAQSPAQAPSRDALVAQSPRIRIATPRISGSISTTGGRLDDLVLLDYRAKTDPDSPQITLMSPSQSPHGLFVDFGWSSAGGEKAVVPNSQSQWKSDLPSLAPGKPVTLSWSSDSGLRFQRVISVDDNYMFTVTQRVFNDGASPVTLFPWGRVTRNGTEVRGGTDAPMAGTYIHLGPVGVLNGILEEKEFDELQEEGAYDLTSTGGWLGMKEQYWLVALIPEQKAKFKTSFSHQTVPPKLDRFHASYIESSGHTVQPGKSMEVTVHLFAGAKEARLLERYGEELGAQDFIMAIDYTWIFFLTIPLHKILLAMDDVIGNYGISILILTVIIKILFFPLANKSYKSMSRLKKLQPKMVELKERFGDDRQRMNQEMMALYKKENANPASGCLPILIQIPVFISLYIVLFVTIEMRHAPFFGWIKDLSAPDPLGLLMGFGLFEWNVPEILKILNVGIWPLIMGATMYLQQKLNPQPADPMQAKIFMLLPIVFTFMLGQFPAGLVIYWAWNNTLSIGQQWLIMRRMGVGVSGQSTNTPPPSGPPRPAKSKPSGNKSKASAGQDEGSGESPKSAGGTKKKPAAASASGARRKSSGKRRRTSKPSKGAA